MLSTVLSYLENTAKAYPQKTALVDRDGGMTFACLRDRSRLLAAGIIARTSARNEPIAVYLPKTKNCIVAFSAILYSGNCYAPLDVKSPRSRISKIIEKLGPQLIISDIAHSQYLREAGVSDTLIVCMDLLEMDNLPPLGDMPITIDTDPIYIMHTSGSTGIPKGVVITHRGVIDYIEWAKACYSITSSDIIGNQAPFYFDNSTLDIFLCLATGATLVVIPEEHFLFPVRLIEYLAEHGITFIFWVPSVIAAVATTDALCTVSPPLNKILFAGEVMSNRHLNYWRRKCPNALFSNLYGPTEITVDCTYYIVDREFADDEPLPIGLPCRNSDVFILNEQGALAAPEERGELCVRGSSLALGYWNDWEKTAASFTQNPLNPHYPERIYRTGDLVYYNEKGEINFAGRRDSQIKHLGYRIELGEIETTLLAIPQVRNAFAFYDEVKKQIGVIYETASGSELNNLRKALLERLPKYMVPTIFIQAQAFPLTPTGKIDRKALMEQLC